MLRKMNSVSKQVNRNALNYIRISSNVHRAVQDDTKRLYYHTPLDFIDSYNSRQILRQELRKSTSSLGIRYLMNKETKQPHDLGSLSSEEIEKLITESIAKFNDKEIINIMQECLRYSRTISKYISMKIVRTFSSKGKTEVIAVMQEYTKEMQNSLYTSIGEFDHYMAKCLCVKGKVDDGLQLLKESYTKFAELRNLYRLILRDIIYDLVLNGSEASLVILKKHVLDYSNNWDDHSPLICLWHICWTSSWFSDQMLADELLESSHVLRSIVKDKAFAFSLSVLKNDFNEDAVVRLLQALLRYKMMHEYTNILPILFGYKLRNRDIRGCTEIIKNCEVLGISLPRDQQGKYVQMLILRPKPVSPTKDFKLKF